MKKPEIKRTKGRKIPVPTSSMRTLKRHEITVSLAESLTIPADLLESYDPPPILRNIVEEFMSGVIDEPQIAENLGMTWDEYVELMRNPFNKAWVAGVCGKQLPHMMNFVDLVMFQKAMGGNVQAYRALMDRFGKVAPTKNLHAHVSASMDIEHLSDDQLQKIVEGKLKNAGQKRRDK